MAVTNQVQHLLFVCIGFQTIYSRGKFKFAAVKFIVSEAWNDDNLTRIARSWRRTVFVHSCC